MIEIKEKANCSGCGACQNICPVNAILMTEDYEGFLYPQIDSETCIKCNKCNNVCPIFNHESFCENTRKRCIYKKSYAVKSLNEEQRKKSSSGGIFYALAEEFLKKSGNIVGAAFDEKFEVYHKIICTDDELPELVGSKYSQSSSGYIFREIKEKLDAGQYVLFVGLSCQVEGLLSYLPKEYDNLYCVDLICMGVPSPGVWRKYLASYFKGRVIKKINYKDKTYGWHKFSMSIEFADAPRFLEKGFDNLYMETMFKGLSIRPSCFKCKFKNEVKRSDITIADCWGCNSYVPEMDDNKGLSMMIVHTEKGVELLEMLQDKAEIKEFDYENVLKGNPNYYLCTKQSKFRGIFMFIINRVNPRMAFELFGKNPNSTIKAKLKKVIRQLCK